jgi:hypothetical protein
MPLTTRTNGSGGSNIIQASWFNDFMNLLTGSMSDQEVTIKNNLRLISIGSAPATPPTGTITTGTNLGIGTYLYGVSFLSPDGETNVTGMSTPVTTTTGNQAINVASIITGPTGTTGRNLYRTTVGSGFPMKLVTTINDNSTTTYADTKTDASLGVTWFHPYSFGGSLVLNNGKWNQDGTLSTSGVIQPNAPVAKVVNGSVSGSVSFYTPIWGSGLKVLYVTLNALNSATVSQFYTPTDAAGLGLTFTHFFGVMNNDGSATSSIQFIGNGTTQNASQITTLGGAAAGSDSNNATTHPMSLISIHGTTVDTIQINATGGSGLFGEILLIGQ